MQYSPLIPSPIPPISRVYHISRSWKGQLSTITSISTSATSDRYC
nr:MAG TPA: hypothetical protein [Caudoviricetes sp.]